MTRRVLSAIVIASALASALWGRFGWSSDLYFFGMFLFSVVWLLGAMALPVIWEPEKRWQAWSLIVLSAIPAVYYPGRVVIVFFFFAVQGVA